MFLPACCFVAIYDGENSSSIRYSQFRQKDRVMHQERPMQLATSRNKPEVGKVAFNWEDPLGLDAELTSEERMVRDTAHGYCQDKLFPGVMSNLETIDTHEGTHDVRGLILGRAQTGIQAFF
jgi:hypothetical protein